MRFTLQADEEVSPTRTSTSYQPRCKGLFLNNSLGDDDAPLRQCFRWCHVDDGQSCTKKADAREDDIFRGAQGAPLIADRAMPPECRL